VLDELREAAGENGLTFAPDPATHDRRTIGRMLGNNSCGVHALMGDKTVDNVEWLDVLLYNGTHLRVRRFSTPRPGWSRRPGEHRAACRRHAAMVASTSRTVRGSPTPIGSCL
jgi:FAD/FMN-containing dehydrogenase